MLEFLWSLGSVARVTGRGVPELPSGLQFPHRFSFYLVDSSYGFVQDFSSE